MKQKVGCIEACGFCAWLGYPKSNLEEHQKSQHFTIGFGSWFRRINRTEDE